MVLINRGWDPVGKIALYIWLCMMHDVTCQEGTIIWKTMWSIHRDAVHRVDNKQPHFTMGQGTGRQSDYNSVSFHIYYHKYKRQLMKIGRGCWNIICPVRAISVKVQFIYGTRQEELLEALDSWKRDMVQIKCHLSAGRNVKDSSPVMIFSPCDLQYAPFLQSLPTFNGWALSIWGGILRKQADNRRLSLFLNSVSIISFCPVLRYPFSSVS